MNGCNVGNSTKLIMDESNHFIRDCLGFVSAILDTLPLPSHLMLFDSLEVQLRYILALHGYKKVVYKMSLSDFIILIFFIGISYK